jgi:hypothetical protein
MVPPEGPAKPGLKLVVVVGGEKQTANDEGRPTGAKTAHTSLDSKPDKPHYPPPN